MMKRRFTHSAVTNWFAWQVPSVIGILAADRIPTAWGLGFAGTLALLGLMCSLLSDRATWVAAAVAGCAAVAAYALPLKLNILVAIAAAVAIGLLMDHSTPRAALPVEDKT
jgi:predicted branched-subunit amino acid permease